MVDVRDEHRWLHRLVGEWTFEIEADAGPDQPSGKHTGTESVRSLDGVWVVCESRGEVPGVGSATSIMTLGYDPVQGRLVGSFVGSMMPYLWVYEGELDTAGSTLTLYADGPSFEDEDRLVKYRDVITLDGDDHRVMTSGYQRDDGSWHQFMTAHYRRVS